MEAPPHEYPHTTHCYKLSVQIGVLLLADVVTRTRSNIRLPVACRRFRARVRW